MQNLNYYNNKKLREYRNNSLRLKIFKNINDSLNVVMVLLIFISILQFIRFVFFLYSYFK